MLYYLCTFVWCVGDLIYMVISTLCAAFCLKYPTIRKVLLDKIKGQLMTDKIDQEYIYIPFFQTSLLMILHK